MNNLSSVKNKLLPCPERIELQELVEIESENLELICPGNGMGMTGALDLADFISVQCGKPVKVQAIANSNKWQIWIMSVANPELEKVAEREATTLSTHSPQGYRIITSGKKLILAGTNETGTFYATRTLKQALAFENGKIKLPLMEVVDFPDLEERGFWDYFYPAPLREWSEMYTFKTFEAWKKLIDEMSDLKVNLMELLVVDSGLNYQSKRFPELVAEGVPANINELIKKVFAYGRSRGIKMVPTALNHPERMPQLGKLYPEIMSSSYADCQAFLKDKLICFSHPKAKELLMGIIEEVAELFADDELLVWVPEHLGHCACDQCGDKWNSLKTYLDICGEAFDNIRAKKPDFHPRVLASFMHYGDQTLSRLPENTDLVYYECDRHGLYGADEQKRFSPFVENAARHGLKVTGCVSYRHDLTLIPQPSTANTREWIQLLYEKGARGVNGSIFSNPGANIYNLTTMADCAWKTSARSDEEFWSAYYACRGEEQAELKAKIMKSVSDGWYFWAQKGGQLMLKDCLYRIAKKKIFDYLDALYLVDNLEVNDLPETRKRVADLESALELSNSIDDQYIKNQVLICVNLLNAMTMILEAMYVYGREQWPDPDKGPWLDWPMEVKKRLTEANRNLTEAQNLSNTVRSIYPKVKEPLPLDLEKLMELTAKIMSDEFIAKLYDSEIKNIDVFA